MATIDKQSVRTEFDKLKLSFDEQVKAGKVSAELSLIFNTMMTLVSLILSIFMEKATKKTKDNSSIPPSQTTTDDSATGNKSKTGSDKNKSKTISVAGNTRTVETITVLPTLSCGTCNEDLSDIECTATERRTKIDIIFEKTEEHIDVEIKQCPACNTLAKAKFPDNMPGPLQYGDGIKAYVMVLLVMQMVSLKRVADMLLEFGVIFTPYNRIL
jgi:transposase